MISFPIDILICAGIGFVLAILVLEIRDRLK